MRVASLASGSKGNAYVVEQGGVALLIDCGIAAKTFSSRLAETMPGVLPDSFAAVLVTHSHDDHVSGLDLFAKRHPDVPVYCNSMTAETVAHARGLPDETFACFENGQTFQVGPFEISPFSIPHDTSDPVGYLVRAHACGADAETVYFHCTDLGLPLDSVGLKFAEADVATLESNHDPVLLRTSGRPPSLIQRIAGPRGHLSNEQACELVGRFASPRLKTLALAHLSRDCNAPHLAAGAMREQLASMGRSDVSVVVLSQDEPASIL